MKDSVFGGSLLGLIAGLLLYYFFWVVVTVSQRPRIGNAETVLSYPGCGCSETTYSHLAFAALRRRRSLCPAVLPGEEVGINDPYHPFCDDSDSNRDVYRSSDDQKRAESFFFTAGAQEAIEIELRW
jgi:hypothetical protein